MNKIKIFTDSCSDLTRELREKYDIEYVKMNTVIDGKEQPASLDWEYFSPKEFYDVMRRGERITTTQVPFRSSRPNSQSGLSRAMISSISAVLPLYRGHLGRVML